jgi:hypothetical protein
LVDVEAAEAALPEGELPRPKELFVSKLSACVPMMCLAVVPSEAAEVTATKQQQDPVTQAAAYHSKMVRDYVTSLTLLPVEKPETFASVSALKLQVGSVRGCTNADAMEKVKLSVMAQLEQVVQLANSIKTAVNDLRRELKKSEAAKAKKAKLEQEQTAEQQQQQQVAAEESVRKRLAQTVSASPFRIDWGKTGHTELQAFASADDFNAAVAEASQQTNNQLTKQGNKQNTENQPTNKQPTQQATIKNKQIRQTTHQTEAKKTKATIYDAPFVLKNCGQGHPSIAKYFKDAESDVRKASQKWASSFPLSFNALQSDKTAAPMTPAHGQQQLAKLWQDILPHEVQVLVGLPSLEQAIGKTWWFGFMPTLAMYGFESDCLGSVRVILKGSFEVLMMSAKSLQAVVLNKHSGIGSTLQETNKRTNRQTNKQTNKHTNKQTNKHTNKQPGAADQARWQMGARGVRCRHQVHVKAGRCNGAGGQGPARPLRQGVG